MKILFSNNKNIDIEQRYIIKKVCAYLIIKNYFEELKTIKNKIKNLNIIKLDKEIKLKIKIIEYFQLKIDEESKIKKSYFEDIWNSLKERNIFVDGTSEKMIKLNQKIKDYVEKNSSEDFINDFDMCVNHLIKNIDFSQDEPQDLDMFLFMKQKN